MIVPVVLASGINQIQVDLIPGSPDNLAIIRKWQDDPYAHSVIAQIPGTDAWTQVASPQDLNSPRFPTGHVEENLKSVLATLPALVERFVAGTANPLPTTLVLAHYLGIYTDEQIMLVRGRRAADKRVRDEDYDRKKRETEERKRADAEKEARQLDESYKGFLRGRTPMQVGKIRASLEKAIRMDGTIYSLKELVEKLVAEGHKVEVHHTGPRIFIDRANGRFHYQKDLSKTAFDYAVFLGA